MMFAYENYQVEPDLFTLAKPLGGGLPLGALIAKDKVASVFQPGDHGTTFGGNPVACAASLAFLDTLQQEDLLTNCLNMSHYFREKIGVLQTKYPGYIKEVRIIGLMIGIEVEKGGQEIVKKMLDEGFLINCTADNVLRLLPPLIVHEKEIDLLICALDKIFNELCSSENA
ncbi:MAG: aminotransferase class III-fold pyridoxal phosphate-dependent enzyme, partial [Candidatus Aminicenantes bacterium]|nr:aminotransferase class III-fold pyridoxal phosphate-dependent enzyme [Candidatus Aminicenantes bacterium]